MHPAMTVAIAATFEETRRLVTRGTREVLRARLAPAVLAHRWAVPLLLEGLALGYQQPVHVVLYAESPALSFGLQLTDDLGPGQRTLCYDVELIETADGEADWGGFDELRRWCRGERP